MNINDVFPSKYLKAADLQGHEPTVIISRCEVEAIGDQRKLVLYFQGKEKGMICNRTNADRIAFLYSPDTDGWIGKPIILFTDMVSFQGKTMQALRVKPPKVNGKSVQPQRQFVKTQHPNFASSTTQAVGSGHPDRDEMESDEVPF